MIAAHRQSITSTLRTITLLAAMTSLLLTMVTPFVGTANAAVNLTLWPDAPYHTLADHSPEATVYETSANENNNPSCAQIDADAPGEVKFEGGNLASNTTLTSGDGLLTVKLLNVRTVDVDGDTYKLFDFEVPDSSDREVSSVFVKQSTGGAFYDYPAPTDGDTHLHPQSWSTHDISHISFCYNPSAELTITKNVINDNGGTAGAGDFHLLVDGVEVISGVPQTLAPGTYTVSEVIPTHLQGKYTPQGIDCGDKGSTPGTSLQITLVDGDTVTCTVTNDDVPGSLTLLKDVRNDNGGTKVFSDFTPTIAPAVTISFQDVGDQDPDATTVNAGTYTLGEQAVTGYRLTSIVCDNGASDTTDPTTLDVAVGLDEHVTCTFVNEDQPGSLIVTKQIVDPDGLYPDATEADFTPTVDGDDTVWTTPSSVDAGDYAIGERDSDAGEGYLADGRFENTSTVCDDGNEDATASVGLGETVTCVVTNTAVGAGLTVIKDVRSNWGGGLSSEDFPLTVTPEGGEPVSMTSGIAKTFPAGDYEIGETGQDGYEFVSVSCTRDGQSFTVPQDTSVDVSVAPDESVICTFVNRDVPASLTVLKEVVNDDGGTLDETSFIPIVNDGDTDWGSQDTTIGDQTGVAIGSYTIDEHDPTDLGYSITDISCYDSDDVSGSSPNPTVADGAVALDTDGSVDLDHGDDVTCVVTNDDEPATLILEKEVTNTWGGELGSDDFTLEYTPSGGTTESTSHGDENTVDAGTYTIGEQSEDGYELVDIECSDETVLAEGDDTVDVTVGNGETVTCTLSNRDIPASLTVLKDVINDDGGTLDQTSFTPIVNDGDTDWGSQDTTIGDQTGVAVGSYTIDEHDPSELGYSLTDISCYDSDDVTLAPVVSVADGAVALDTDGTVDLDHGDDVTCIVTNDDEPGELTLVKEFENAEGGPATEDDFVPTIDDEEADWGANTVEADTYTIDEIDALGSSYLEDGEYVQVSVVCDGQSTNSVTVVNGGDHECVITNRPVPAGLTIVKQVNNNWGGEAEPNDFGLTINDDPQDSGVEVEGLPPGEYEFSEQMVDGYEQVDLFCASSRERDDLDDLALATSVTLEVRNNENLVCTFVNRDLPASLTVLKDVVNDDGGTATEDDFTPLVDEVESDWGVQGTTLESEYGDQTGVPAGSYTIGELLAEGYSMSDITCTDETVLGDEAETVTVELGLDDEVTCTIVNDDIAPTVVLRKTVINDDGGTLTQDDFPVTFDDEEAAWDEQFATTAGDHTAAEQTQPGYLAGDWGGDCEADGSLAAELAGTYECTITNDDVPAGLTVVKEVVNDDGGTAEVGDFPLSVTPEGEASVTVTSGVQTFVAAGTYTISEEQQPGYALDSISCDNGVASTGDDVEVTVGLDEAVICTIVNDDLPIGIQVIKTPDVEEVTFDADGEDQFVTYSYTVTNTGETTLTDLSLFDDVLGDIELPVDELVPNQTVFGEATHLVTAADAVAGEIVNVAVVEGTSPDGRTTDDEDDAEVVVAEVAVLPGIITRPPAPAPEPAPEPAPAPAVLAVTGIDTTRLALFAALIAGLGVMLLLGMDELPQARRRRARG